MTVAHEEPNYMGVFWWLLVLTILEICVIYAPIAHLVIVLLLIGMALTKATLVASTTCTSRSRGGRSGSSR